MGSRLLGRGAIFGREINSPRYRSELDQYERGWIE
jgi:hypothetical protein